MLVFLSALIHNTREFLRKLIFSSPQYQKPPTPSRRYIMLDPESWLRREKKKKQKPVTSARWPCFLRLRLKNISTLSSTTLPRRTRQCPPPRGNSSSAYYYAFSHISSTAPTPDADPFNISDLPPCAQPGCLPFAQCPTPMSTACFCANTQCTCLLTQ